MRQLVMIPLERGGPLEAWDASCGQGPLPGRVAAKVKSRQSAEWSRERKKHCERARDPGSTLIDGVL